MKLQLNINQELTDWLDTIRGDKSRAVAAIIVMQQQMKQSNLTKDTTNGKQPSVANGTGDNATSLK